MMVQASVSTCRSEVLFDKQTKMEILFPKSDAFNLPNGTPFPFACLGN